MITLLICLLILTVFLGIAFMLTGALLKAVIWLCVSLPVGIVLLCLGIVCCCTIILIPVGLKLFKAGFRAILPG